LNLTRIATVVGLAAAVLSAADDIEPEHGKLNTGDAATLDTGGVEIGFGCGWEPGSSGVGPGLAAGALANLDFGLGLGWTMNDDRSRGFGDVDLSGHHLFLQLGAPVMDVAVISGVTLSTGDTAAGFGQGYSSRDNSLAASADFVRLSANAEMALALPIDAAGAGSTPDASLALGCQVTDWLQPEGEVNYGRELADGAEGGLAIAAGLVAPLTDLLLVKGGVSRPAPDRTATGRGRSFRV
jgi:hypothetical protein